MIYYFQITEYFWAITCNVVYEDIFIFFINYANNSVFLIFFSILWYKCSFTDILLIECFSINTKTYKWKNWKKILTVVTPLLYFSYENLQLTLQIILYTIRKSTRVPNINLKNVRFLMFFI